MAPNRPPEMPRRRSAAQVDLERRQRRTKALTIALGVLAGLAFVCALWLVHR